MFGKAGDFLRVSETSSPAARWREARHGPCVPLRLLAGACSKCTFCVTYKAARIILFSVQVVVTVSLPVKLL